MKFMIFVIDDSVETATKEEMVSIDAFNDKLQENGHWIFAGGLSASQSAELIDNRGGVNKSTSGGLFPAKENYSGFWLIQAESLEVARELAFQGSQACNRKVELRPLLG